MTRILSTLLLAAAVAVVSACGGGGGGSSAQATPVTIATPVITAPQAAAYDATSLSASVVPQDGCSYSWTAVNATILTGGHTPSITFQPVYDTAHTTATLSVTVSAGNSSKTASVTIQLGQMPSTPTFVDSNNCDVLNTVSLRPGDTFAVMNPVLTGTSGVTYTWIVAGGDVQSGQGSNSVVIAAGPVGTMSITCRAVSTIGLTSEATATVPVFDPSIAPPEMPIISGPNQALLAGSTGLVYSVQPQVGCSYRWDLTVGIPFVLGGFRNFNALPPVSGQGTTQVVMNTPKVGGGGGDTVMAVRVVVSNAGGRAVGSQGITLM